MAAAGAGYGKQKRRNDRENTGTYFFQHLLPPEAFPRLQFLGRSLDFDRKSGPWTVFSGTNPAINRIFELAPLVLYYIRSRLAMPEFGRGPAAGPPFRAVPWPAFVAEKASHCFVYRGILQVFTFFLDLYPRFKYF
ncbi:MAG: hypothetical protein LBD09_03690 [Treponema sp.]|nr:hypothetical protein [Treponema sp.]